MISHAKFYVKKYFVLKLCHYLELALPCCLFDDDLDIVTISGTWHCSP
jgi:hypothetical protein